MGSPLTTLSFIEKAKIIHNDSYDYSKVNYIKSNIKVEILCKTHGTFFATPNNHLRKRGCPECAILIFKNKKTDTLEKFITKSNKIHNNKYDYSESEYINSLTKIKIICPQHGEFKQCPSNHISGQNCPKCNYEKTGNRCRTKIETFIEKCNIMHSQKYDYSFVDYKNNKIKIKIKCKKCNKIFQQIPSAHLRGDGCKYCMISSQENELYNWIKTIYNGTILQSDRKIIKPLELDIVLPDLKFAIEYNGIYWHSSKFKDKDYHTNKTINCKKAGYELWHIPSILWIKKPNLVKFFIEQKLKQLIKLTI